MRWFLSMVCGFALSFSYPTHSLAQQLAAADPMTGTIDPENGFLSTSAPIQHSAVSDGAGSIVLAAGTTAYSAHISVGGQSRRYVVVRPQAAPAALAPVLLLLHPLGTSPESMAYVTTVSDYVLTQGFWAVLPMASGSWEQDPGALLDQDRDVAFISALIDKLVAGGQVDAGRIYAAGYSEGGFMTERLACELGSKIAAFAFDAALLRSNLAAACPDAALRAKLYFLGTADFVVPYTGIASGLRGGVDSAAVTMAYWQEKQGCGGLVSTTLPQRVRDGTSVQLDDYTGCAAGTALQLYTIHGGGHTWPGGQGSLFGATTQNIAATGLIWLFVSPHRR